MRIIFCEECGGKNEVSSETVDSIDQQLISCRICDNDISHKSTTQPASSRSNVDTSIYHVLFIDDDLSYLVMVSTLLKTKYKVSIAATGNRGLVLAEKNPPDLILLDVNMPIMNGYEVCRALKVNKKTRHIPIIFVTAETESDEEYKGLSLGAVDYITKPFNFRILHARIELQLKTKLMQDDLNKKYRESSNLVASLHKKYLENEIRQENIRMTRDHLEMILDSVENIVIIQGSDGRITWVNSTAQKLFGKQNNEISGRFCHEILPDTNTDCRDCPLTIIDSGDFNQPQDTYCKRLKKHISISHLPMFDDNGKLSGVAHMAKEITATEVLSSFRKRPKKT